MKEHLSYHTRLTLAFNDLVECENYGKLLIKNSSGKLGSETKILYDALLTSFFVSYGRAFKRINIPSDNLTNRKFKDFINKKKNKLSIEKQNLHNDVITQRDKIFAHSDIDALGLAAPYKLFDSYWYISYNKSKPYPNKTIVILLEICDYFSSEILKEKTFIEEKHSEVFDKKNT